MLLKTPAVTETSSGESKISVQALGSASTPYNAPEKTLNVLKFRRRSALFYMYALVTLQMRKEDVSKLKHEKSDVKLECPLTLNPRD